MVFLGLCLKTYDQFGGWNLLKGQQRLTSDSQLEAVFASQETFDNICRHLWLSQLGRVGALGIQWVGIRDDPRYPSMHRTPQQELSIQNVHSAKAGQPASDRVWAVVAMG